MTIMLPDLPYEKDALEPHISSITLDFHHGKHHNAYVTSCSRTAPVCRLKFDFS